ncbi:ABC transporter ATP-binding protein [Sporolactobacillus terrae]|uniref:ABC transporter ATP-binding protein n=1 Tax=Sporolactobacillus terrae TaxID=269673 RepID=A0A410DBB4_9BACL|nr:ABC transporter ATP-binding protein [Sporolactobacillus terrae]QAA23392.1 ABC transporter ATP-binding protein [Sporolactobacillus terrae]QAA26363.1 ABC transporter ATP-binding protein [Sporolactobacillus terrae]BBN99820.1 ABC transporter ATP-binding protein [Sporolactobacillus terrae]
MVATGQITFNNLRKVFPPRTETSSPVEALHHVNAEVEPGEFIALIGPSGCGKSTLLRLLAGLDQPSQGKILVDGNLVERPSRERGLVFQDPTLYPWLTIEQNVGFGPKLAGEYREKRQSIHEFIELVGLKGFEKNYPYELSGGMQQRVALARTLINYPKVLLFDEPFGALDAFTRMKMHDELLKIRERTNITMVMVTHDVEEAVYLADRVFTMTPRPAILKKIVDVNLPRPRRRDSTAFIKKKEEILDILNFTA